ncbi:ABC transporter ATP-binding protein [Bacillus sp. TS-2]|nr:ABC transporter ATP-binding protein [Bacillus sp. TS-2]
MSSSIQVEKVSKIYRKKIALDQLSLNIGENKLTGIVGRNGVGKTTLLKLITGFIKPTSGQIKVLGLPPFNQLEVSEKTVYVDDHMYFSPSLTLQEILAHGESFYPNWNMELAQRLLNYFSINLKQSHAQLSKGTKSTFNVIFGLATAAEITVLDEPTTGMDLSVRQDFYRALIKDYIQTPRTILLSSHHLDEIENLIEDVVLIDKGKVKLHVPIEELKQYAIAITGEAKGVREWAEHMNVLSEKKLTDASITLIVKNSDADQVEKAKRLGFKVSAVSASDTCVYLTDEKKGGIEDVFK